MNSFTVRGIQDWALESWMKVAYLIINWNIKDLVRQIEIKPEQRFYEVISKHVNAYVQDGVMPPEDIAPAILNIADDFMAGRAINLRAGDYIAIQNHVRRGG
jgi:hypothetical protein